MDISCKYFAFFCWPSQLVLIGECIAGALTWKELVDISKEVGFNGPYLVEASEYITMENKDIESLLGEFDKWSSCTK